MGVLSANAIGMIVLVGVLMWVGSFVVGMMFGGFLIVTWKVRGCRLPPRIPIAQMPRMVLAVAL